MFLAVYFYQKGSIMVKAERYIYRMRRENK